MNYDLVKMQNLYAFCDNYPIPCIDYLGMLGFLHLLTLQYGSYPIFRLLMTNEAKSWRVATLQFSDWLAERYETITIFDEETYQAQEVKKSIIGNTIRDFFLQKNRNARYCEDWQGVTNYATKFPGWDTLKFAFGNETEKQLAYNHVMRFYSGLKSGVVSFIGSSDAAVDVELINKGNAKFILAKFKVINKTSLKSALFHLIPDSMNKKIWIQEYRWKELFSCCLMPPEERMKRAINEIILPSLNSFPYNINEVNLTPIGDPFFIPGIR